jgi:hypothetical protein
LVCAGKEFRGNIGWKVVDTINLPLLPAEMFVVLIGEQNVTGPPIGGDHDGFT